MRHKFQQVLNKIHDFLNGYDQPDQTETNSLTATIEEAIQKQTAVHLILSETSFTGDIIKPKSFIPLSTRCNLQNP
ncbi:hypothetical protein [Streptococcus pneumoniae]|uniref:hypothetical protein n=1 Tax=Streptococcus pneumoniae TaxID=1313 RepID=UPI0010241058|nr:hypothetical protein [Streptococcus pneumoniae]VFH76082.1 Uncharacterised protein [Streptococcus pneumoniae]VLT87747.1 Uncharacterised protein [Streptococcus pneumoniae]